MFYTISNDYIEVKLSSLGATINKLILKSLSRDVVLGYENEEDYLNDKGFYFGGTIGRVANRIKDGQFTLDGTTYTLDKNDNGINCLHGGEKPFSKREFSLVEKADDSITFKLKSPDNDQGFPGNLTLMVTYKLDQKSLIIKYMAYTDKDTPINITCHPYFNLDGSDNILNHELQINASTITEVNDNLIPTGNIKEVYETPYDFTSLKLINKDMSELKTSYDTNYIINQKQAEIDCYALSLKSSDNKVQLLVETDYPGIQIYTGYYLKDIKGKDGKTYNQYAGIAIEPQFYPDSVNNPSFPSIILKPKKLYSKYITYKFIF